MNNRLTKHHWLILTANILIVAIFAFVFISNKNNELINYILLVLIVGFLIAYLDRKIKYTYGLLWGLSLWSLMHFAGGGIIVNGRALYDALLIPITNDVFRYDQLVHIIGFGMATMLVYQTLKNNLKYPIENRLVLGIVVIMAGLGIGAFNEIVEFIFTLINSNNDIGGYLNTSLDLVADLIGAFFAYLFIYFKYIKYKKYE